ncbi:hypothetical protein COP2_041247 [Malus domestica]
MPLQFFFLRNPSHQRGVHLQPMIGIVANVGVQAVESSPHLTASEGTFDQMRFVSPVSTPRMVSPDSISAPTT